MESLISRESKKRKHYRFSGKTIPLKPYTECQLITLMKICGKFVVDLGETKILKEIEGLGTEVTRSRIIETIKKNGHIQVTKIIVSLTNKGRILCEVIGEGLLANPSTAKSVQGNVLVAHCLTYARRTKTCFGFFK